MNREIKLFTSESVCEGHPDKLCDQIADAVLDEALKNDPNSRVACEVIATSGQLVIFGEMTTAKYLDIPTIARGVVKNIGYVSPELGFNHSCAVMTYFNEQSADISIGVDRAQEASESGDPLDEMGAGDQGMMFGFATKETDELMPSAIVYAHKLTKRLTEVRKSGLINYLRPDGKAQVTMKYEGGQVRAIDTVVVSAQHEDYIDNDRIRRDILDAVIMPSLPCELLTKDTKFYINPTGRFVIGGPVGDSGLTGRKIIVDTYGGYCPHGGGAFSGKDATKVDRSSSYYARKVCKNIVAAGLADKIQLQVAYAIGRAHPVSLNIDTFGTGKLSDEQIIDIINRHFDFRPYNIIRELGLTRPIFFETAKNGHFGKDGFSWEQLDKVEALKQYLRK